MKTVNHWEFHRERRRIEIEINKPFDGIERIWFIDTSDDETIRMGLNIAATSTMDITSAEVFAKTVENAVHLAKTYKYNGYKKVYGDWEKINENI